MKESNIIRKLCHPEDFVPQDNKETGFSLRSEPGDAAAQAQLPGKHSGEVRMQRPLWQRHHLYTVRCLCFFFQSAAATWVLQSGSGRGQHVPPPSFMN